MKKKKRKKIEKQQRNKQKVEIIGYREKRKLLTRIWRIITVAATFLSCFYRSYGSFGSGIIIARETTAAGTCVVIVLYLADLYLTPATYRIKKSLSGLMKTITINSIWATMIIDVLFAFFLLTIVGQNIVPCQRHWQTDGQACRIRYREYSGSCN